MSSICSKSFPKLSILIDKNIDNKDDNNNDNDDNVNDDNDNGNGDNNENDNCTTNQKSRNDTRVRLPSCLALRAIP